MRSLIIAIGLSIGLIGCIIVCRPIIPIDETRYLSVAWEMKWRGDFLVSHMSGETYSHKPPLLFWLINLAWVVFGQSDLVSRLVAPCAGIACLPLIRKVARGFWSEDRTTADLAPLILIGTFIWTLFLPMTMFDTLVTMSVLIATVGLQSVAKGSSVKGWSIVGVAIGIGILSKGPVIFLFVLPATLCFAWQATMDRPAQQQLSRSRIAASWLIGFLAAFGLGAAIALAWAIPSAIQGGKEYASDLFLGQTAGRMVKSFAHKRPIYWFLPFLPIATLPWLIYKPTWNIVGLWRSDRSVRMLTAWMLITFSLFSVISGKQLHYILPLATLWALLVARAISSIGEKPAQKSHITPVALSILASIALPLVLNHVGALSSSGLANLIPDWIGLAYAALGLAVLLVPTKRVIQQSAWISICSILWAIIFLVGTRNYWMGCDLSNLAIEVGKAEKPIAWLGDYQAQLNYLGRIQQLTGVQDRERLIQWLEDKPEGIVIYPSTKVKRSANSPATGFRKLSEADIQKADQIAKQLLDDSSEYVAECTLLFTRNRELYTEDYWVFQVVKQSRSDSATSEQ